MTDVGVVFYVLHGEHHKCGSKQHKLGIVGGCVDLETFRRTLCKEQGIDERMFKLEIFKSNSRESLTSPATEIRSYEELRVVCSPKTSAAVLHDDEKDAIEKERLAKLERERLLMDSLNQIEANVSSAASTEGTATTMSRSRKEDPQLLTKMSKLTRLTFPLSSKALKSLTDAARQPILEAEVGQNCFLCELAIWEPTHLSCCNRVVCSPCLMYVRTLMKRSDFHMCPICGAQQSTPTINDATSLMATSPSIEKKSMPKQSGEHFRWTPVQYSDEVASELQHRLLEDDTIRTPDANRSALRIGAVWTPLFNNIPSALSQWYQQQTKAPRKRRRSP